MKNLTTAEGGAVCFNLPNGFDSDELYKEFNIRSLHGQSKDALAKTQIGNWRYDVLEPGYKCNMMDIQAAIGLVELGRYESSLTRRKQIFKYYKDALSLHDWAIIPEYKNDQRESSYHLFLLRIDVADEDQRDEIIQKIFEKEVSVNVHFQPLPMFTAYKKLGFKMEDYPESFKKYENVITLPVYYDLTDDNIKTVVNAVVQSVNEVLI